MYELAKLDSRLKQTFQDFGFYVSSIICSIIIMILTFIIKFVQRALQKEIHDFDDQIQDYTNSSYSEHLRTSV